MAKVRTHGSREAQAPSSVATTVVTISLPTPQVELDREFAMFSEQDQLDSGTRRTIARLRGRVRRWEQLAARVVIILGESGSGKTAELAVRAATIRALGEYAFAFRLAELRGRSPQRVVGRDWELYEKWLASDREATFLMDGLDEAKLAGETLDSVLDDLGAWCRESCRRIRLVISVRPSLWDSAADMQHLRATLRMWGQSGTESDEVSVVSLLPLDLERGRKYAQARGVSNVDKFIDAVQREGLDDLMERPLDVEWLASRWIAARRFGTLREMIDANIIERLTDRRGSGRVVNLAIDRARLGAQCLSTVATLSGLTSFPVRDGANAAELRHQPVAILRDWRPDEVQGLLQLPIFDEATQASVRIHIRYVQEFLCAEWFRERLEGDILTLDQLSMLLFRKTGDVVVVPDHLKTVAAWLAVDEPHIREQLIEHAPHQLLDEGDPASLPIDTRERVLRSYAALFGDRDRSDINFNRRGLRRFAAPELAPLILELMRGVAGADVRATLLDIVAAGRLRACADLALAIATASTTDSHVRYAAIRAAAQAGTSAHRAALAAFAVDPATEDRNALGTLIAELFPEPLTAQMLRQIVARIAHLGRWNRMTRLDSVLMGEVVRRCPASERLATLDTFRQAVALSSWLQRPMLELTAAHLESAPCDVARPEVQRVLASFDNGEHAWDPTSKDLECLSEVATRSEVLRRELLRWFVHRRREVGESVTSFRLRRVPFVGRSVTAADLLWLEAEVPDVAEAAAMARNALTEHPPILEAFPKTQRKPSFPPDTILRIADHLEDLRGGHLSLLQFCTGPYMSHDDWGSIDAGRMQLELGDDRFAAIRAGLTRVWRSYQVPAPSETDTDDTPGEVVLGLIGLGLEFQNGLNATMLSADLARRAARFALWELNHFPPWFHHLMEAHPDLVMAEVTEEAIAEVRDGTGRERLMHKAFAGPPQLQSALARSFERRLLDGTLPLSAGIEPAIELLLEGRILDRPAWAIFLRDRLASARLDSKIETLLWGVEMYAAPSAALDRLHHRILSSTDADVARARDLFEKLWSWLENTGVPLDLDADALERLYIALVSLPPTGKDGSFAAPQRLRAAVIRRLEDSGANGRRVFLRLAKRTDSAFMDMRDFHLAAAGRATLGDPSAAPMSRDNAIQWMRGCEAKPTTDDGLFDIVLARLTDIATFLRASPFTYRDVFAGMGGPGPVEERYFQLWLASELQNRRARRYEIIREEEERNQKKPDMRAHVTTLRPTSIEVKVAESWSLRELRDALKFQLVGQYMGEISSHHGILVLCATRHNRTWTDSRGRRLRFDDLVDLLRADAEALIEERNREVRKLEVFVLDFRGSQRHESKKRKLSKKSSRLKTEEAASVPKRGRRAPRARAAPHDQPVPGRG